MDKEILEYQKIKENLDQAKENLKKLEDLKEAEISEIKRNKEIINQKNQQINLLYKEIESLYNKNKEHEHTIADAADKRWRAQNQITNYEKQKDAQAMLIAEKYIKKELGE